MFQMMYGLCLLPCKGLCVGGRNLSVKERATRPQFHCKVGAYITPANVDRGEWGPRPPLFQIMGGNYIGFHLQYVRLSST